MGTAILLLCISALLLVWDIFLKAISAICRPAARAFLDARVSHMAARLMRLARVYGRLTVELDDRLKVGLPNPCLVCANHQSVADIAVLLAAFKSHNIRFVAKHELTRGFPAVSEVLRIQQHALIDRHGGYRNTAKALSTLGKRARCGVSPVVFAEGTRSRTGEVKPFHTGGVRSILRVTPLPIVGVAIDGGHYFASMENLLKSVRGLTYRIGFVGVFDPGTTKGTIQAAVESVHTAVTQQIEAWHRRDAALDQTRGT
jgi:1-acyl-sn-glycerol-3-phosphate acyltransferase